ncbi:hypothetical protein Pfo_028413 [Paulownia fortunei]|nr:hypothetical protein Pfo_028413 [Paulownia fortunei]
MFRCNPCDYVGRLCINPLRSTFPATMTTGCALTFWLVSGEYCNASLIATRTYELISTWSIYARGRYQCLRLLWEKQAFEHIVDKN